MAEHGANMTCTILHEVLHQIISSTEKNKAKRPQHLWIQADNCAGENKNNIVLAFCGWLVANGVFKTVQLNHLMVGHTHEDIDAFGAIHAKALRGKLYNRYYSVNYKAIIYIINIYIYIYIYIYYESSSDVQVLRSLEDMLDVIRGAHPLGTVTVLPLHHQFDWKSYFYPPGQKKGDFVQSVKGINYWRSFEISMDVVKQVTVD